MCQVSENFFTTFGVRPAAERALAEGDKQYSEAAPVMISYRLWQRTFKGDAALPGESVMLNGSAFRVVGVLPREFRPPGTQVLPPDVWMPFSVAKASFRTDLLAGRDVRELDIWTRLRNREDKPRVEAALNAVTQWELYDLGGRGAGLGGAAALRSRYGTRRQGGQPHRTLAGRAGASHSLRQHRRCIAGAGRGAAARVRHAVGPGCARGPHCTPIAHREPAVREWWRPPWGF